MSEHEHEWHSMARTKVEWEVGCKCGAVKGVSEGEWRAQAAKEQIEHWEWEERRDERLVRAVATMLAFNDASGIWDCEDYDPKDPTGAERKYAERLAKVGLEALQGDAK